MDEIACAVDGKDTAVLKSMFASDGATGSGDEQMATRWRS
jgi:hypothetical protein